MIHKKTICLGHQKKEEMITVIIITATVAAESDLHCVPISILSILYSILECFYVPSSEARLTDLNSALPSVSTGEVTSFN